ncbi:hypothetical protein GCM10022393_29750 [Aquimarina addita]|uniref:2TM domain-containing protein n=1 Tax=Aquimarina addita TaxID=870485 RepID=A0ABP6UNV3_9FLAO
MNDHKKRKAYEKAKKQVEQEKRFYSHLTVYIIINCIIIFFRIKAEGMLSANFGDEGFKNWVDMNILITPLFWGIGLLCHGLWVFKRKKIISRWFNTTIFSEDWEKRKIEEFMNKDDF